MIKPSAVQDREVSMHRHAAWLLCWVSIAVADAGLLAAPAPFPRSWVDGWDRPVNPTGRCRFEQKSDKLTITVSGPGHDLDADRGRLTAPLLLRPAEGDFVVQLRVDADYTHNGGWAGIVVCSGPRGYSHALGPRQSAGNDCRSCRSGFFDQQTLKRQRGFEGPLSITDRSVLLRLSRRGEEMVTGFSTDGVNWRESVGHVRLPRKVKVGVFMEATAPGTFQVVFDRWELKPLPRKSR
jgi:hypothetical protein